MDIGLRTRRMVVGARLAGIGPFRLTAWLMAASVSLLGQQFEPKASSRPTDPPLVGVPIERRGVHLERISVYQGSSSAGFPSNVSAASTSGFNLQPDLEYGGDATFSWRPVSRRFDMFLLYAPSYQGRKRYSEWNTFNQFLSFKATRKVARRWNLELLGQSQFGGLAQFLFTPVVLGRVENPPTSIEELLATTGRGTFTNDELASILTGAPVVKTPARPFLGVSRVLSNSVATNLAYAPSGRLTVDFNLAANRHQEFSGHLVENPSERRLFIPSTTSAEVKSRLRYQLTKRTRIGTAVTAVRTLSLIGHGYATSGAGFWEHDLTKSWVVNLRGGIGRVDVRRDVLGLVPGPDVQLVGGGTVGYHGFSHTLSIVADRQVGDSYGLGSQRSLSTTGVWNWWRPGRSWGLYASGGHTELVVPRFGDLNTWMVAAGTERALSEYTSMRAEYAYFTNTSPFTGILYSLSQHSVRVSFTWRPAGQRHRQ